MFKSHILFFQCTYFYGLDIDDRMYESPPLLYALVFARRFWTDHTVDTIVMDVFTVGISSHISNAVGLSSFQLSIGHLRLFLSFVVSSPLFIPNVFRSACIQFIHLCPNGLFCIHLTTSRIICCCALPNMPKPSLSFCFSTRLRAAVWPGNLVVVQRDIVASDLTYPVVPEINALTVK